MYEQTIAIDLGGTHLRAAVISRKGEILKRIKQLTPKTNETNEILKALSNACKELIDVSKPSEIKSVSVVVPGTVHVNSGYIVKAPNLVSLEGFDLSVALENELNIPVFVENDANAAGLGEMWLGAAKEFSTIIFITLGTGVGGSIILNGKLWKGIDGSAGELGHIGVNPYGPRCGCGSFGCLEVFASATAIVRMTKELGDKFTESTLNNLDEVTAKLVYTKGIEGDGLALEVFNRVGFYLGVGIASLINIVNPEIVVVGGGVTEGWELFNRFIREEVNKRAFPEPAQRARIIKTKLGDDAGLLGAAYIAFENR